MLRRHFAQFLNEDRAARLQPLDHIAVMHDLMPDIDRRAMLLQRQHDNLDRPVNAGAKAARAAEADGQRWFGGVSHAAGFGWWARGCQASERNGALNAVGRRRTVSRHRRFHNSRPCQPHRYGHASSCQLDSRTRPLQCRFFRQTADPRRAKTRKLNRSRAEPCPRTETSSRLSPPLYRHRRFRHVRGYEVMAGMLSAHVAVASVRPRKIDSDIEVSPRRTDKNRYASHFSVIRRPCALPKWLRRNVITPHTPASAAARPYHVNAY